MKRPRILMASAVSPAVFNGAGTVTRNLIRLLESPPLRAEVECLSSPLPARRFLHSLRQARAVAHSLAGDLPAKAAFTFRRSLRREFRERAPHCDAVVLNGAEMLWLMTEVPPGVPCTLVAHNIEHRLFVEQAAGVARRFPLLDGVLQRECEMLRAWEIKGMRAVGRAIFLSADDACEATGQGWIAETRVLLPVFFDPPGQRRGRHSKDGPLRIAMLANLHWWPNGEGLTWFRERVLPHVGDAVLHVFGPGSARLPSTERLIGHGPVADLRDVWESCDLTIAPLLHGGGISVKVAEGLYHGVPLLGTSCSVRGLRLPPDSCIAVADAEEEWISILRHRALDWRGRSVSSEVSALFDGASRAEGTQRFVMGEIDRLP